MWFVVLLLFKEFDLMIFTWQIIKEAKYPMDLYNVSTGQWPSRTFVEESCHKKASIQKQPSIMVAGFAFFTENTKMQFNYTMHCPRNRKWKFAAQTHS